MLNIRPRRLELNQAVVFCDYSNYEFPVGFIFKTVENSFKSIFCETQIVLKAVSQEFAVPYDEIPKGHKTICKFELLVNHASEIIGNLPLVNKWYDSDDYLLFSE